MPYLVEVMEDHPSISSSSSSSSLNKTKEYDVFLSFRGKDTRKNFTDHLYAALNRKGIITFKDDQKLEKGNAISAEIIQAIRDSRISLVIFSKNYASSSWCLDELLQITKCSSAAHQQQGQTVFPVFYGVQPSEVRKQTGRIGRAFAGHEEQNLEKVQRWRIALTQVANLSGWVTQDRCESEVIQEIVQEISKKLSCNFSSAAQGLVGIDPQVEEICLYLSSGMNDVRMAGICGMGGMGKTTIARVVYEKMACNFEGSCFLANVREVQKKQGLASLQEQLLSEILLERNLRIWDAQRGMNEIRYRLPSKRVLIVLDDVDQLDQLNSLAGLRDWFGKGSRIIITTRDEQMLICHGVDRVYRLQGLNQDEALHLFCLKAFKNDYPEEDYVDLSNHFANYANGLPLALVVLGSFLFNRSVNEWRSALDRLKEIPNKAILDKLQISFDGLEEIEKAIFLDIACFFKGKNKDYVTRVLECRGLYPDIGIRILIDKSLVTISENRVRMHDLLQEMGRAIVRQASPQEPGRRSRLWLFKDVHHVFTKDTGTEDVEGIVLDVAKQEEGRLSAKAFMKMKRLKLLKLKNVHLCEDLEYLSNELQYLEWYGYPLKSLPPTFQPLKLAELNLRRSQIIKLWTKMEPLEKLKFLDLSHCQNLRQTPDFEGLPNLETLNLEGCTRLLQIHKSIGVLRRLVSLNLKGCNSLLYLPSSISGLKSLKTFVLSGCSKLEKLPEELGSVTCLEELDISRTAIRQLPSSLTLSKSLQVLSIQGCKESESKIGNLFFFRRLLPRKRHNPMASMLPSLSAFGLLRNLDLSYCNLQEGEIPDNLGSFPMLEKLNLSGNDFASIPTSVGELSNLQVLVVNYCARLKCLPKLPPRIQRVFMYDCYSLVALPDPLEVFKTSESFECFFTNCFKLPELQGDNCPDFLSSFLKRELHSLLNNRPQGFFHFLMSLPAATGIPGWFNNEGDGGSIRIELPPHWCNAQWKGFAVCALFVVDEQAVNDDRFCSENDDDDDVDGKLLKLQCFLRPNTEKFPSPPLTLALHKDSCFKVDSHWLLYIPERCYPGGIDWWNKCSHIGIWFATRGLEMKKCGARLVFEQDVEALNPDYESSSRDTQVLENSIVGHIDNPKKRSRDDCCSDVSFAELPPKTRR